MIVEPFKLFDNFTTKDDRYICTILGIPNDKMGIDSYDLLVYNKYTSQQEILEDFTHEQIVYLKMQEQDTQSIINEHKEKYL